MKTAMFVLLLFLVGASPTEAKGRVSVSFGVFYSSLTPHGEWIAIDGGLYAWRPIHVVHGWRPYSIGRWVWTDDGWYWVSGEPWGWATYHYGRWYYDDYYGWIWIPGYDWSPAWVEWRYGGNFFGWAPLGPYAVFSMNAGVRYPHSWVTPDFYWSFVNCRYVTHQNIHKYVYKTGDNKRYIGQTRSIGSIRSDGGRIMTNGPDRGDVERRGNIRVSRAEVVDVEDRGVDRIVKPKDNRERIEVYRPAIEVGRSQGDTQRPDKVRETKRGVALDSKNADVHIRRQELGRERDGRQLPPQRGEEPAKKRQHAELTPMPRGGREPADVRRQGAILPTRQSSPAERVLSATRVENAPPNQGRPSPEVTAHQDHERDARQPALREELKDERSLPQGEHRFR